GTTTIVCGSRLKCSIDSHKGISFFCSRSNCSWESGLDEFISYLLHQAERNSKIEIRMSKQIRIPQPHNKTEFEKAISVSTIFEILIFGNCFGIRVSNFGWSPPSPK